MPSHLDRNDTCRCYEANQQHLSLSWHGAKDWHGVMKRPNGLHKIPKFRQHFRVLQGEKGRSRFGERPCLKISNPIGSVHPRLWTKHLKRWRDTHGTELFINGKKILTSNWLFYMHRFEKPPDASWRSWRPLNVVEPHAFGNQLHWTHQEPRSSHAAHMVGEKANSQISQEWRPTNTHCQQPWPHCLTSQIASLGVMTW